MAMTKKHFEELARIAGLIESERDFNNVVTELALMCKRENRNFDPGRFWDACEQAREDHKRASRVAEEG